MLIGTASDIAPAGIDDVTGSGQLNCLLTEAPTPDGPPLLAAFPTDADENVIYAITTNGRLAQILDTNKWNVDFPAEIAGPPFASLKF